LAACGQGTSTTAGANAIDNTLADAPPPATALPLATGAAPAYTPAPPASALPPAPRARLGRVPPSDQYAYLNEAYDFSQSLADAPPDYGFDYQGEQPWVWQSPDGYYRVAERLPMGVRYFYYAPGASTPYFVQDPHYSYAYSQGYLAAVYGPNGELVPEDVEAQQAEAAGLYLAWAAGLYEAARHREHVPVSQTYWDSGRQAVYADQSRWSAAQHQNPAWASYSQAHQDDQAHWAAQRYVRAAEAARFAQAVNDPAALAHAQRVAVEASSVAQAHGERLPGPAPEGGFAHREGAAPAGPAAAAAVGLAAAQHQQGLQRPSQAPEPARAPYQAQDQAQIQARAGLQAQAQRQAEQQAAAQAGAQARAQQEAQATASRQAAAQAAQAREGQAREAQTREAQAREAQAREGQARQAQAQAAQANAGQARQAQLRDQQAAAAARQSQAAEAAQRAAAERAQAQARSQAVAQAHVQAVEAPRAPPVTRAPPAPIHVEAPRPAPHPPEAPAKPKPEEHRPT